MTSESIEAVKNQGKPQMSRSGKAVVQKPLETSKHNEKFEIFPILKQKSKYVSERKELDVIPEKEKEAEDPKPYPRKSLSNRIANNEYN